LHYRSASVLLPFQVYRSAVDEIFKGDLITSPFDYFVDLQGEFEFLVSVFHTFDEI